MIMLNERELKEKLKAFAQNEFRPSEGESVSELIPEMLKHIGSTDSELRDDLIYTALAQWILRYHAVDPELMRGMLPVILDDQHMLYKLGEQNTESVFTRTFSILVLPLLLISHREQPLFSQPEINRVKEALLYYLDNEKDLRGFVPGPGWAHGMAHAADALDDLAQCAEMTRADLIDIMGAIRSVVCVESECYAHSEEERLITPVLAVLGRGLLSDEDVITWLEGFAERVLSVHTTPAEHYIRENVKNFLQSLYFRLGWSQKHSQYADVINRELRRINPFARSENG